MVGKVRAGPGCNQIPRHLIFTAAFSRFQSCILYCLQFILYPDQMTPTHDFKFSPLRCNLYVNIGILLNIGSLQGKKFNFDFLIALLPVLSCPLIFNLSLFNLLDDFYYGNK